MKEWYSDLALNYIQGCLSAQEKRQLFRLLTEEPEFRELMRLELQLASVLGELKTTPPQPVKNSVYSKVTCANRESHAADLIKIILTPILNIGLPNWASQIMTYSQRSV